MEDILIAGKPKSLARDTGLHPVDAWRIYAAAQGEDTGPQYIVDL